MIQNIPSCFPINFVQRLIRLVKVPFFFCFLYNYRTNLMFYVGAFTVFLESLKLLELSISNHKF